MLYLNGSRSHPVAIVDDRRVRPYGMKEGEGAHYAPDGSEQMSFVNEKGYYVVSLDGPSVKDKKSVQRMASLRHVNKKMQSHDGKKVKEEKDYKHEGESINTEVRCTKDRIEFRAGTKVVGYYEVSSDTWYLTGKLIHNNATETMKDTVGQNIERTAGTRIVDTAPKIDHN
jgi:hypothetical protein